MRTKKRRGFTLVELMIVIAIMGILTTIAIPSYQIFAAQRRLNGAARMVVSDLMAARMKAVTQNNEFKVFFNANHHEYTILDDDNGNSVVDTGEATEIRDIQRDYYDVTFTATDPIFYPRGTASVATITLTSSRTGVSKAMTVAITGRVKID